MNERTAAKVLLRAGTLTGWIGSTRQITGAQETAKNLMLGVLQYSTHCDLKSHPGSNGTGLFTSLADVVHQAQVDETRARVMLAEGGCC